MADRTNKENPTSQCYMPSSMRHMLPVLHSSLAVGGWRC